MSRLLLILLASALWFLSMPGSNFPYLAWFATAPLILAIYKSSPLKSMLLTYSYGIIIWLGSAWWGYAILYEITHSKILATVLLFLLCLANGFPYALFGYCSAHLNWYKSPVYLLPLSALFTLLVYLMALVFPGYIALSQYKQIHLIQILDVGGIPLLIFLMTTCSFGLACAWISRKKLRRASCYLILALLSFFLPFIYGKIKLTELLKKETYAPQISIALLQPNYPVLSYEKTAFPYTKLASNIGTIETMLQASQDIASKERLMQKPLELIVWPELPYLFLQNDNVDKTFLQKAAKAVKTPLIYIGENHNNFIMGCLLQKNGEPIGRQYKVHLIPFAEYLPLKNYLPKNLFAIESHEAFNKVNIIRLGKGLQFSILICYDAIFKDTVREAAIKGASFIVCPANDSWFGNTSGPHWAFAASLMQATAFREPLIRAANSGVTAIVTASGKIHESTEDNLFKPEVLRGNITILKIDSFYKRFPNVVLYFLAILTSLGIGFPILYKKFF
jgi:apolipoprotein N-acyltransferase